jgi:hypothetical protein
MDRARASAPKVTTVTSVTFVTFHLLIMRLNWPVPEAASAHKILEVLVHLQVLLQNLPKQLPKKAAAESLYGSLLVDLYLLDADILKKTGDEVATLGEQLERIFG